MLDGCVQRLNAQGNHSRHVRLLGLSTPKDDAQWLLREKPEVTINHPVEPRAW